MPDQVIREIDLHFVLLTQRAKHVKDCRQLLFGEKVDLQIKMGTFVSLTCHTILRHQDEHGKKNGLQRYDQRQKAEWKGSNGVTAVHPKLITSQPTNHTT